MPEVPGTLCSDNISPPRRGGTSEYPVPTGGIPAPPRPLPPHLSACADFMMCVQTALSFHGPKVKSRRLLWKTGCMARAEGATFTEAKAGRGNGGSSPLPALPSPSTTAARPSRQRRLSATAASPNFRFRESGAARGGRKSCGSGVLREWVGCASLRLCPTPGGARLGGRSIKVTRCDSAASAKSRVVVGNVGATAHCPSRLRPHPYRAP